jgi:DNA-binding MarR family transcriptional regulator
VNQPLYLSGVLEVKSYRIVQTLVSKTVKLHGISTATEWFILSHLYHHNSTRAADLAELLSVDPPHITTLAANLEAAGLLQRKAHRTDKRVKIIRLTRRGRDLVPRIEKALETVLDKLLEGVTDKDMNSYRKVLEIIVKNS